MVSQGISLTLVFLLVTLITLGEANNNRKLLYTYNNYQPQHSPLPSPVYSSPADLPPPPTPVYSPPPADLPPPPTPYYSPPADLPPPTPIYPPPVAFPPPQAYQAYYYRKSPPPPPPKYGKVYPPPPAKPWWWLLWSVKEISPLIMWCLLISPRFLLYISVTIFFFSFLFALL